MRCWRGYYADRIYRKRIKTVQRPSVSLFLFVLVVACVAAAKKSCAAAGERCSYVYDVIYAAA